MIKRGFLLLLYILLPVLLWAEGVGRLWLPHRDLLPSEKVLCVIQDSEGALWYGTDGGGVCRDDGHDISVFRNDADHPELLGSNNVGCLAEAGRHIVIGTSHGASVLDKRDYSVRRLDVDDKRVDDILVRRNGDVLLTCNMKVYHYDARFLLKSVYSTHDKYVARLYEDRKGGIWATQWYGGLLRLRDGEMVAAPWPLADQPTALADAGDGSLWIGTVRHGIVRYHVAEGHCDEQPLASRAICLDLLSSADHSRLWAGTADGLVCYASDSHLEPLSADSTVAVVRLSLDLQGRLLVACGQSPSYAVGQDSPWATGTPLSSAVADSVKTVRRLSVRPEAMATDADGRLWFSTGRDIRCQLKAGVVEEVVLGDTKDVSAMAFGPDGTLWLSTIYGVLYTYRDGKLQSDDYGSDEHGDAIRSLRVDGHGLVCIATDRSVRLYNPQRRTMRQQSIEAAGTYRIELRETAPGERWSSPRSESVVERMPWWAWLLLSLLVVALVVLLCYVRHFLKGAHRDAALPQEVEEHHREEASEKPSPWLEKAIAQVEMHLSDESYSVDQLAQDLCMSRMTFYRKIQTAAGQKPTEFVRTIRLRRAAELLRQGDMSVSEISYATGFSSVSYFSRCFRAKYGVPPTQFTESR